MINLNEVIEKAISKEISVSFFKKSGKGYFINLDEYTNDGCQRTIEVTKRAWLNIDVPVLNKLKGVNI